MTARWSVVFWLAALAVSALACKSGADAPAGSAATGSNPSSGSSGSPAAPLSPDEARAAYSRDIDRICNAESHSGAAEQPQDQRNVITAQWLATAIETDEARGFLVSLRQAAPSEKVELLEGAARDHGVSTCALADTWREHAAAPDAE